MNKIKFEAGETPEPTFSEFSQRVFNGDGLLFLINDDFKFSLDLAIEIGNIVDEKFLVALHNITIY